MKVLLEYTVESWIGVTLVINCSIIWLLILLCTSQKYGFDKTSKSKSFAYFMLTTVNINLRALINKGAVYKFKSQSYRIFLTVIMILGLIILSYYRYFQYSKQCCQIHSRPEIISFQSSNECSIECVH